MERLDASASCQDARITSGTSTAMSISMTSAMPSAAKVKLMPHAGIHAYDSRNWSRSPGTWKATHMKIDSTSTSSDQTNATRLASSGLDRGSNHTTTAPTSGATVSTDRNGKSAMVTTAIPSAGRGTRRPRAARR